MSLRITGIQSGEPITLAEAKTQLLVSHNQDDDYITSLIAAARTWCEHYCNRHFVRKAVEEYFGCFADIDLERPVIALQQIDYRDMGGAWQILDAALYDVSGDHVWLKSGQSWPALYLCGLNVKINYTIGIDGDGAVPDQDITAFVPADVKHAIKLLLTHWYETRSAVSDKIMKDIPFGVENLLGGVRWVRL